MNDPFMRASSLILVVVSVIMLFSLGSKLIFGAPQIVVFSMIGLMILMQFLLAGLTPRGALYARILACVVVAVIVTATLYFSVGACGIMSFIDEDLRWVCSILP